MTSILTNNSAMAALQTLRTIGSSMAETQRQVSSGLRVQVAADNAAYWSISTTMRSDNMALSAVSDALGLGAAKVDIAYAATTSIVDILTEFKARLVAASEDGVDRSKIQEELSQLNAQAESVVASASFNGVNWLKTTAATHLMETPDLKTSTLSSFVRTSDGSISLKASEINLKNTSMLNLGGGGILQKEIDGIGDIGGFRGTNANSIAHQGHESHSFTGPATFGIADYVEFGVVIDAGVHSPGVSFTGLRIDKNVVDVALGRTDGTIRNASEMRAVLQKVFVDNSVPATAYETLFTGGSSSSRFEIGSLENTGEPGSSIDLFNVISDFNGAYPAGFAMGLENPPVDNHDNMYPVAGIPFTKGFTVSPRASFWFDVQVGPSASVTYVVDRAVVDAALGSTDGYIGDATALATVIEYVTAGSGLTATPTGNGITFAADQAMYPEAGNRAARVSVGNVRSDPPWALMFDLAEIDVTTEAFTVDEYIEGVEYMLQRSISSGSVFGALSKRIEMQTEFTAKMIATIDKGIGRLVDADMNEASTRLKALQTQEQLAIQSLSIANASAENIMQLFR